MRIIGNWIPFIGFRDLMKGEHPEMLEAFGFHMDPEIIGIHVFELEWLNRGITIMLEPIYEED